MSLYIYLGLIFLLQLYPEANFTIRMLFCYCHSKRYKFMLYLLYLFEKYYINYIVDIIEKDTYSVLQYKSTNIYYLYL